MRIRNLGSCYIYLMISYAYMLKCVIARDTVYTCVGIWLHLRYTRYTYITVDRCAACVIYKNVWDTVCYSIKQIRIPGCNPCRAHRGRRDQLQTQFQQMCLPIFTGFVQGTRARHISPIIKQSCTHLYKLYHAYHVIYHLYYILCVLSFLYHSYSIRLDHFVSICPESSF